MGWYMLAIAILYPTQVCVEDAESIFYTGHKGSRPGMSGRKPDVSLNKVLVEARRKGMQYNEIGKMYGLSAQAAFRRIQRAGGINNEIANA